MALRYGDALGWRNPAHIRSVHPEATTASIIKSSGRVSPVFTGIGIGVSVIGVVATIPLIDELHNRLAGRLEVSIDGVRPSDYPSGYTVRDYKFRDEDGTEVTCTLRVGRNAIFRRRFYISDCSFGSV